MRSPTFSWPDWLAGLDNTLRQPVRLRIEGERVALPGPAMTPYLVGLLVLLGMLGTFLGMVVTLNGAVTALESTADLPTMRAALTAPVRGLGLSFGTSVAGVAASAMLGLVSALCRRERLQAAQGLDTLVATVLRGFSAAQQREDNAQALQRQAQALPALVDAVQRMTDRLGEHSLALHERLLAGQDRFHREAQAAYTGLAGAVEQSLKTSVADSSRQAAAAIQPVAEAALAGLAQQAARLQAALADTTATRLDGVAARFDSAVGSVTGTWAASLAEQQRSQAQWGSAVQAALAEVSGAFGQRAVALGLQYLQVIHAPHQGRDHDAVADDGRQTGYTVVIGKAKCHADGEQQGHLAKH